MSGYDIALFLHLLSLLVAVAVAALSTLAALRLRGATATSEARQWVAFIGKVVRVFPIAIVGLLLTGGYMAQSIGGWSNPWIVAAVFGLVLIAALGAGVEGSRGRLLRRELETAGWSDRARQLTRDPVFWSARGMTLTLVVAVVFIMTAKPSAVGCVVTLAIALVAGVLVAMPLWSAPKPRAAAEAAPNRVY